MDAARSSFLSAPARPHFEASDAHAMAYRPDVDGLRALAVLSVILFHLSGNLLPGGYLGVDVFFVLSGFLITSIIWQEARVGNFSLARFYDRRIRRIMPALLLMLAVTTIASLILLLPSDLTGYGRSLLATIAFVANIYFWRDTDYFASAAESKPLLHMWSLGVEEQFYVLFPLLVVLLARYWRKAAAPILLLLTVGSLGLDFALNKAGGGSPAFYLLPTRAWELGAGAVLAVASIRPRKLSFVMGVLGMALLALGLTAAVSLPAVVPRGVLPVAGTILLIAAGSGDSPVSKLLQLRPIVFVGLVSFSLYLWHWPVIVLMRYYLTRELGPYEMVMAGVLTAAAALLSWRFVEQPLRDRSVSMRKIRVGAAAVAVGLATVAIGLVAGRGFPERLGQDVTELNQAIGTHYRCPVADMIVFGGQRACEMNLPSRNPQDADVVLLGNSHAQAYAPGWAKLLRDRGTLGLLVPLNWCLPTTNLNLSPECLRSAAANLREVLALKKATTIVLAFNWWQGPIFVDSSGATYSNTGNAALMKAVDDLVLQIKSAGKRVVLLGPLPQPGWDVPSIVSRSMAFGHKLEQPLHMPLTAFTARFGGVLAHYEGTPGVEFVRVDRVQCAGQRCEFILEGKSLYADGHHLAAAELHRFESMFSKALNAGRQ